MALSVRIRSDEARDAFGGSVEVRGLPLAQARKDVAETLRAIAERVESGDADLVLKDEGAVNG